MQELDYRQEVISARAPRPKLPPPTCQSTRDPAHGVRSLENPANFSHKALPAQASGLARSTNQRNQPTFLC